LGKPGGFEFAELAAHILPGEIVIDLKEHLEAGVTEKRLPGLIVDVVELRQVLDNEEELDPEPGRLRSGIFDHLHPL